MRTLVIAMVVLGAMSFRAEAQMPKPAAGSGQRADILGAHRNGRSNGPIQTAHTETRSRDGEGAGYTGV
jgi:hypothetical protein